MIRNRPTILVTGFGPFPGAPRNASSLLAETLADVAARRLPGLAIRAETLPTEWQAGPSRLAKLLAELDPVAAIHFGVSHRARGFVVETRARNRRQNSFDACGAVPGSVCVAEDGPGELPASLPTGQIADRLRRRGLPAQMSRDAGGYLCNAVLYHSLDLARRNSGGGRTTRRGFIHIPDSLVARTGGTRRASASLLDWEDAVEGGIVILATCAAVIER